MLDTWRLEKPVKIVSRDTRVAYFDPVALIVALLRGDARRIERSGWALDAVKADKTSLKVASNRKVGTNFMTESEKYAHQTMHLETKKVEIGRMVKRTSNAAIKPILWVLATGSFCRYTIRPRRISPEAEGRVGRETLNARDTYLSCRQIRDTVLLVVA